MYLEQIDDGNDVIIQKPIGLVKVNPDNDDYNTPTDMILYGDSENGEIDLNSLRVVGFRDNTVDMGLYGELYDTIVAEDSPYYGALTDCTFAQLDSEDLSRNVAYYSGAEKTYHTFISKLGDDADNEFIIMGASTVKCTGPELKAYIAAEFVSYPYVDTVILNANTRAQMYNYVGNQWQAPVSKLPVNYYLHNDDVATAVVLYEKAVAKIPDPIIDTEGGFDENKFKTQDRFSLRVGVYNTKTAAKRYPKTPCYTVPEPPMISEGIVDPLYYLGDIVNTDAMK